MSVNQVNTTLDDETFRKLKEIEETHGSKPPAIVRLALADFLPRYLSARGDASQMELLAKVGAALRVRPYLATDIDTLIKRGLRQ